MKSMPFQNQKTCPMVNKTPNLLQLAGMKFTTITLYTDMKWYLIPTHTTCAYSHLA